LISVVIYSPGVAAADWAGWSEKGFAVLLRPLKREWFQTLMHIAVTSVWIVPVVRASLRTRALFAAVSGLSHVVLSNWFNFTWVNTEPWGIDGGPLGFLTWTIPAIVGTVACDGVTGPDSPKVFRLSCLAVALMVAGWGFSCGTRLYDVLAEQREANAQEKFASSPVWPDWNQAKGRAVTTLLAEPPFVRPPPASERKWNYWMMSQRAGTLSYLTFSAGFSLLVFIGFWWCCDRTGWRLGLFQTLGTNALAAYVIHGLVDSAISPFVPRDAPVWYVSAAFACYFALTWGAVKGLERQGVFLRV
ncbi:MAG: hypothetical protein NT069_05455, partial [Planctomycetota bacterium]|nr:hypothetical protein [Planctomycetota bacterium]